MQIIYAQEKIPESFNKTIFLAGPTPKSKNVKSWRPEAIQILKRLGYDGIVFYPEHHDGNRKFKYNKQIEWEEKCLNMADCIVFWVPRNLKTMPAFTTNTEWGVWQNSGKVVFGAPKKAAKIRYQRYYAKKLMVPNFTTLNETLKAAQKMIGNGALRTGGEREVPLYLWKTSHFQNWYSAQKQAGNRLDGAKVEWVFRVGPKRNFVFFWALHVNIHITSENRNKINEVVIFRPDVATIVMYRRGKSLDDSDIVLIREFRSPAATDDGFVWEIPGGSSFRSGGDPLTLAASECKEEAGLKIEPSRIRQHKSRQLVATLSAHKAYLFSVEITEQELEYLCSQRDIAHGVEKDTERTYVEIKKLGDIKKEINVDWSMLGMILSVLYKGEKNEN